MQPLTEILNSTAVLIASISAILLTIGSAARFGSRAYGKLNHIYMELTPNGGGSIKDAINRIEAMQRASLDLTGRAYWLSDAEGRCTFASSKLAGLMGVVPEQVLGLGWVSTIAQEDREHVRREWDSAVLDRREFRMPYSYIQPDGAKVPVVGHAVPVVHSKDCQVLGMIGWAEERAVVSSA